MGVKDKDFISVGELSVGFSENMMQPTNRLVGKDFSLYSEGGKKYRLSVVDIETLKCVIEDGDNEEKVICAYTAVMPREDIYFIDFIVSYGETTSMSIVLDYRKKMATVISSILPAADELSIPIIERAKQGKPLTSVNVSIEHASMDSPWTEYTPKHEPTSDLIGKTIEFVYSSKDAYQHTYLNEDSYTWHCIAGNEKGLCDTDQCFYYKLDDKLYLFIWLEKVIPTAGIVIEDLDVMRSYGKIYGYESHQVGRVSNFPVGSYAKIINKVSSNRQL
ncbi:molybdenum cofactor biosynthesis protein F [Scopulibacillus darangshiensis]|uniref:Molybdenum cofactor biosynthesis protein F n=1 Tax=Scopulibacillus darangshiensis TaxID=442528 RepID=A0A4R2P963_9BACL|nr:MoaF C-terminal domain-containing protein [Scopulibacillus darangshiensis]TCP30878.1 molybdenum cofactor biosynthesis protein F [Scopulibacillus darangshiensis]